MQLGNRLRFRQQEQHDKRLLFACILQWESMLLFCVSCVLLCLNDMIIASFATDLKALVHSLTASLGSCSHLKAVTGRSIVKCVKHRKPTFGLGKGSVGSYLVNHVPFANLLALEVLASPQDAHLHHMKAWGLMFMTQ